MAIGTDAVDYVRSELALDTDAAISSLPTFPDISFTFISGPGDDSVFPNF